MSKTQNKMRIKLSQEESTLTLLDKPVPEDNEIFSVSYGNTEVLAIIKRELKKQYKDFQVYVSTIGFKPVTGTMSFYATDFNSFRKAAPALSKLRRLDNTPLFPLHGEIFGERSHGEIIAARRKEMGMTQGQLAEQMGMTNMGLSLIENGTAFNAPTVKMICEYLHISFNFPRDVKIFERRK